MLIMMIRLLTATFGASLVLAIAFNLLKIERRRKIDWDGIGERALIVIFYTAGGVWLLLIPLTILLRVSYYLYTHWKSYLFEKGEPALDFQRAEFKTEMLLDLILSPALGLLVCLIL